MGGLSVGITFDLLTPYHVVHTVVTNTSKQSIEKFAFLDPAGKVVCCIDCFAQTICGILHLAVVSHLRLHSVSCCLRLSIHLSVVVNVLTCHEVLFSWSLWLDDLSHSCEISSPFFSNTKIFVSFNLFFQILLLFDLCLPVPQLFHTLANSVVLLKNHILQLRCFPVQKKKRENLQIVGVRLPMCLRNYPAG